ncbi:OXA1 [Salix viminalis]|uniref:OXA1 n=1 Tax=Salix viminalis TaxID=40686 RepID=A0A9Q0V5B1_SALVM|nr:OXA1 [Salix viminalis]
MAFMRSLSTRSTILKRQHNPRLTYILHDEEDDDVHQLHKNNHGQLDHSSKQVINPTNYLPQRSFNTNSTCFASLLQEANHSHFAGACFARYMSTTTTAAADKINVVMDTVAQAAPPANEVAIAAADSYLPVAALQHVIDAVHNFTGLNWWASIVVTTLLIRSAMLPLLINQLKATSKLSIMRPHLEEVKQRVDRQAMDPTLVSEGQKEMQKLFKEHGVSPFTPLKGLFIQGPVFVSFFLAISNMAEKVPSFKSGGAYWFVDLTTPDGLYICPVLTALTFLITVECNSQEGMEGNNAAGTMKNVSRALAVASVPLTMNFPKAVFCYWVTSNLFSLAYGLVVKAPGVKKFLRVPEVPVAPPTAGSKSSSFDLFSALKQLSKAKTEPTPSLPVEPPKLLQHKKSPSSGIGKRISSLEKGVKGRKKNKKR